jgi:hypothetical protein
MVCNGSNNAFLSNLGRIPFTSSSIHKGRKGAG